MIALAAHLLIALAFAQLATALLYLRARRPDLTITWLSVPSAILFAVGALAHVLAAVRSPLDPWGWAAMAAPALGVAAGLWWRVPAMLRAVSARQMAEVTAHAEEAADRAEAIGRELDRRGHP